MPYTCPNCASTNLTVTVLATAALIQQPDGEFETDLSDSDHEWNKTSPMRCEDCGHAGDAGGFQADQTVKG